MSRAKNFHGLSRSVFCSRAGVGHWPVAGRLSGTEHRCLAALSRGGSVLFRAALPVSVSTRRRFGRGIADIRWAGQSHSVPGALLQSAAACFGLAAVGHAGWLVGTFLSHCPGIPADDWAGETEYRSRHVAGFGRFSDGGFLGMGRAARWLSPDC